MRTNERLMLAFMAFQYVTFFASLMADGMVNDALSGLSCLFMCCGIWSVLYGLTR